LWAILISRLLREPSFHAVEQLVRSPACRALCVSTHFGDDALGYFMERLDPAVTRGALLHRVRLAKRKKAFDNCRFIGLAIDGTSAGRSAKQECALCRPVRNAKKEVTGYDHRFVAISVVGAGVSLPFDAEPYEPGDSEYAAGQRLLALVMERLYRIRYLQRRTRPVRSAEEFCRLLWLNLSRSPAPDSSCTPSSPLRSPLTRRPTRHFQPRSGLAKLPSQIGLPAKPGLPPHKRLPLARFKASALSKFRNRWPSQGTLETRGSSADNMNRAVEFA
jgi:hypothetical protein